MLGECISEENKDYFYYEKRTLYLNRSYRLEYNTTSLLFQRHYTIHNTVCTEGYIQGTHST